VDNPEQQLDFFTKSMVAPRALKKAAVVSKGKDECKVRLKGGDRDYWMGTDIVMLSLRLWVSEPINVR